MCFLAAHARRCRRLSHLSPPNLSLSLLSPATRPPARAGPPPAPAARARRWPSCRPRPLRQPQPQPPSHAACPARHPSHPQAPRWWRWRRRPAPRRRRPRRPLGQLGVGRRGVCPPPGGGLPGWFHPGTLPVMWEGGREGWLWEQASRVAAPGFWARARFSPFISPAFPPKPPPVPPFPRPGQRAHVSCVAREAVREARRRGRAVRANARAAKRKHPFLAATSHHSNNSPATPPTAAGTPPAAAQSRAGGRCTGRPRPRAGLGSVGGWWEEGGGVGRERVSANRAEKSEASSNRASLLAARRDHNSGSGARHPGSGRRAKCVPVSLGAGSEQAAPAEAARPPSGAWSRVAPAASPLHPTPHRAPPPGAPRPPAPTHPPHRPRT